MEEEKNTINTNEQQPQAESQDVALEQQSQTKPEMSQEDMNKLAEALLDNFLAVLKTKFTDDEIKNLNDEDMKLATDALFSGQVTPEHIVSELDKAYHKQPEPLPSVIKTDSKPEIVKGEVVKMNYKEDPNDKGKHVAGFSMTSEAKDNKYLWVIATFVFGIASVGMLGAMVILNFGTDISWMVAALTFFGISMTLMGFIFYLGKKTHAILEFKAMFSRKPLCMFFTDTKRVDWAVMEDEGGIVTHKKYGTFLVNDKSAYIDSKTRNVFLAFNPSIATNANIETFKLTDAMSKVIKDERELGRIRYHIANSTYNDETESLVIKTDKGSESLKPFQALRENIDFSHLKNFSNSLLPHNIGNKVQLEVQRNILARQSINIVQIILVFAGVLGAIIMGYLIVRYFNGAPAGASMTTINNFVNGTASHLIPTAGAVTQ